MRVLYVLHRYHTNMIATMKGWIDHGDEICVITQYEGGIEDHTVVTPKVAGFSSFFNVIEWLYVNVINRHDPAASDIKWRYGFPPMNKIKRWVQDFDPDIVILRERSLYTMIVYSFCKRMGYKCILYNLTPVYAEEGYFKNDLPHRVIRKLTPKYRISPTRQLGIDLEKKKKEDNAFFAPFIVEPKLAPNQKKYYKDGKINVFEIGKYQDRKNHYMMVNAIIRLKEKYPNIHLTIAGDLSDHFQQEYYDKLSKYVDEAKLSDKIDLLYNLSKKEVDRIYEDTDLFVLTSTKEPASITVIESMCFCVPSMSGTDNGTADYIVPGITGEVFEDCCENDLVLKMDNILSDKNNIPRMGKAAYEHVCNNFQFEHYYDAIAQILENY